MCDLTEGGWAALNPAVDENGEGLGVYLSRTANPSWDTAGGVGWGGLGAAGTGDSGHGHAQRGQEAKEGSGHLL